MNISAKPQRAPLAPSRPCNSALAQQAKLSGGSLWVKSHDTKRPRNKRMSIHLSIHRHQRRNCLLKYTTAYMNVRQDLLFFLTRGWHAFKVRQQTWRCIRFKLQILGRKGPLLSSTIAAGLISPWPKSVYCQKMSKA